MRQLFFFATIIYASSGFRSFLYVTQIFFVVHRSNKTSYQFVLKPLNEWRNEFQTDIDNAVGNCFGKEFFPLHF